MSAARSNTWMPMYWGDYVRDTAHLSAAEHGAYLMLIAHYWTNEGPFADENARLARIARMTEREWKKARPIIERFFRVEGGVWHHDRIDHELSTAKNITEIKSAAGKEGARKRWRGDSTDNGTDDNSAIAQPMAEVMAEQGHDGWQNDAHPQPQSQEERKYPPKGPPRGTDEGKAKSKPKGSPPQAVVEAFERFWSAYPKRAGENPRKPALDKFATAVKNDVDPETIIAGAKAYARQQQGLGKIGTTYIATAVVWINQMRWADHAGQANGTGNGHAPEDDVGEEMWSRRLRYARKHQVWSRPDWGPWPNEANCRVPLHLLQPGDGEGWHEHEEDGR